MATFSLGTSGIAPGAPGVYINEQAGKAANADLADFSTVYMLVETDQEVPVTRFPFNTPTAITSLNDYKELTRVGTSTVPEGRIPLLSYNCVNEFFQNAQVGDLRVVRVGTPNQIVEVELFPSGSKINSTSLPSGLQAGNKVYVQMEINGLKLVAGDGSTGYTSSGEWLGVPVTIPVNYVAGDEANNRKISAAIAAAVAEAIETNPAVRSSVYVRESGLVNDQPNGGNSENGFVSIASTTFNGNVSVVTQVLPVGSNFVFMQNAYDLENIVGGTVDLERTPQDYTQCIATAFDGQQDQGYLITPTAYAQFDAKGRATVGAAAAAHCENNNYKWMALADPGPFLITDVNKYEDFTPHQAAADLVNGQEYLVDNAIYEWTGTDISYNKLPYQSIVYGESAEIAVNESAELVSDTVQVGILDNGQYTATSAPGSLYGVFPLDEDQYWPVTLPIQQVSLTQASGSANAFNNASIQGTPGTFTLNGTEVFVVAPPADIANSGQYSLNKVYLAKTAADASNIYNQVVLAGGTNYMGTTRPTGAIYILSPNGTTCLLSYADPYWDFPVDINGQTSNLIENIYGADAGVNTLHFPGTLQNPTDTYRLSWISRTIFNASGSVANYTGTNAVFASAASFAVTKHGLRNGQKIFFTQPITMSSGSTNRNLVSQTTKITSNAYWVKVIDADHFALANSLGNYTVSSFINIPSGFTVKALPTIFYSQVLGGGEQTISPTELLTLPTLRGRKYAFDTSSIFNEACAAGSIAPATTNPTTSIYIQNNSVILGKDQINPYGENLADAVTQCSWLPEFNLVNPNANPSPTVDNAYCTPTVDQFFQPELYFVPAIDAIEGGSYDPAGVSSLGPIATLNNASLAGGVGGAVGFYAGVPVTGGSGSGATVNVTIANTATVGPIASLGIFTPGTGSASSNTGAYTSTFTGVATGISSGTAGSGATLNVTVTNSSSVGPVVNFSSFNTLTPDTGGVATTFINVAASSVSGGTGLQVDVSVDAAGAITAVVPSAGFEGINFATSDVVTFSFGAGGTGDAAVNNVNLPIVVSNVVLNAAGTGYNTTSVLNVAAGLIGGVTGFTVNVSSVTLPTGIVNVTIDNPGVGFTSGASLTIPATAGSAAATIDIATIVTGPGSFSGVTAYPIAAGLKSGSAGADAQALIARLVGVYFNVTTSGTAPDGFTQVQAGGFMAVTFDGSTYSWVAIAPLAAGGDLTEVGQPCYGGQVEVTLNPEEAPPTSLWRFDAITSTEIIDNALRGVGFNGVPQAVFVESGVDNVNRLLADSQRYFNPFGFIAYYGPYIENGAGQFIPPSPYVTGVAVRRYRAEGYQFPPAGVKYQLADAVGVQIPVNSSQQNLLNPKGCNVVRTLPGYPQTAVFIWGGRTRVNEKDAQQRLYQFVNTRVILNVVYGSLRNAFDSQIFNVIDGFGVIFNQIISVGNSVLNQLYVRGALFGARPKDAFQVICDNRINPPEDIENGIVNAKVFVTPVPTLERIQIDLIRVAIGKMQQELDIHGLGENNSAGAI